MDRDDRRAAVAERQRVLEVRERGPEPAQEARQRPRHAQHLRLRAAARSASTPSGHELGVARDGGEAAGPARHPGSSRSRFCDVRLVAGALPPEHVGVEEDERRRHASLLGRPRPSLGGRLPRRSRARAPGRERAQLVAPRNRPRSMPAAIERGVERVDEARGAVGDLLHRRARARDDRRAAGERLEHREAEALVQRG